MKDALQGKESFSDITFTSSDLKKILAHKVILKARCPKLVEPEGIQKISSFNHKTIQDFFYYLYTDQLPLHEKTRDEISDLVQISDLFNLPKLKAICIQWIESSQFKNGIFFFFFIYLTSLYKFLFLFFFFNKRNNSTSYGY